MGGLIRRRTVFQAGCWTGLTLRWIQGLELWVLVIGVHKAAPPLGASNSTRPPRSQQEVAVQVNHHGTHEMMEECHSGFTIGILVGTYFEALPSTRALRLVEDGINPAATPEYRAKPTRRYCGVP